MAGQGGEGVAVGEDLARLRRAAELGIEAADRLHLLLELVGDVDDEGRLSEILAKADAMDQLPRAMLGDVGRELRQPGYETGIAHQSRRRMVIRMTPLPRRRDDDLWLESSDRPGDHLPSRQVVPDAG